MPPLLVIPALPRTAGAEREALPALPALPVLSELLRLADVAGPDADWRSGMLRDLGAGNARVPEAVVAAAALQVPAGRGVCLATPAHAVAGLHRVHLHAAGVLSLAPDEREELAREFRSQFGPDPCLRGAGNQWLLESDCASAADETDPADWLGAPLERRPASSPAQRLLRRLGTEVEMWLADLPLNERRRSRRQLPVNLLWMWGGGQMPVAGAMPALRAVRLYGSADDAWLAGCAALCGGAVLPLPADWSGIDAAGSAVVLPAAADERQLVARESDWFEPALRDLRAGRIQSLRLRVGQHLHHVRPGRIRGLLRRRRPWWQAVGA
jgi:hypothetical protein